MRHQVGRALSPEEKLGLEMAARGNPDWENARLAMTLALNTTMRACEVKGLQWRDVDFLERTIIVRESKTDAGRRVIPLNDAAWDAIMELYHRAQKVAGTEPDHHVFPACENGDIDPATPQKSWRSAWRSLRKAAGLGHLRFHDLRHHAITELAESDASEQTIMSVAGHVSRQMLEHYSHVRLEAKRRAVEALSQRGKASGHVTNHVTNEAVDNLSRSATQTKDWSACYGVFEPGCSITGIIASLYRSALAISIKCTPLGIGERTVKAHVAKLMRKVGVENRVALTVHAITHSLVSLH